MFRFVHTSDLHLGKRFGNLPEDVRGRLREARHGAIGRIAAQAANNGASAILVAGDTFDTETPSPAILRQALAEMGHHAPLRWIVLPGNHDSLLADQLWDAARSTLPSNVILATAASPIELAPDVVLATYRLLKHDEPNADRRVSIAAILEMPKASSVASMRRHAGD